MKNTISFSFNSLTDSAIPLVEMELTHKNRFFQNHYLFKIPNINVEDFKEIEYNIYKNKNFIGNASLKDNNFNSLMEEFLTIVDDCELTESYESQIKEQLLKESASNTQLCKHIGARGKQNVAHEVYQMRKNAGLI